MRRRSRNSNVSPSIVSKHTVVERGYFTLLNTPGSLLRGELRLHEGARQDANDHPKMPVTDEVPNDWKIVMSDFWQLTVSTR